MLLKELIKNKIMDILEIKDLDELSEIIKNDIDFHCETIYDDGHRKHLGASIIGHDCKRYLWYVFRWCYKPKHDGRQQRLFNRGHREEERFTEWLRGIGFTVWDIDESNGKQFRISDCCGHFGGSLDGAARFPQHYKIETPVLLEYKTNGAGKDGKGKAFQKLQEKGLESEKYQHFAQASCYGYKMNLAYVLYLNINKNDDTIHAEIAKLDMRLGQQMIQKAEMVITSPVAPNRLSNNPNHYKCKMCDMKPICHEHQPIEKNCRSCSKSVPIENAEWGCSLYQMPIPEDFIIKACELYEPII